MIDSEQVRRTLKRLVDQSGGETMAGLSRMLRKPNRYLDTFVREGRPKALKQEEGRLLASYFRVDPQVLGVTPARR